MDYPRFVARQTPIGSGAVESTCKVLIAARTKGAGMRWSRAGAQALVSLRALHRSGRWDAFWHTQPQRRALRLHTHPRARPLEAPPGLDLPAPRPAPPPPPAPPELAARPRPAPLRQQRPFLPPRARSA
jgi:hypothetical protein